MEPNTKAAAAITPTSRGDGPPWMPVSCTFAWPFPRASSHRLTGTATTPATASAKDSEPQKSTSSRPACMAPGMASMTALSTISMVAMLSVSEASAIGTTTLSARPARSSGRLVSE